MATIDDFECFNCGGQGHLARECPSPQVCYICMGLGHCADECQSPELCYNCLGEDHLYWECPSPEYCRFCPGKRHFASTCLEAQQKIQFMTCSKCGGLYHFAKDCLGPRGSSKDKSWSSRPVHSPIAAPAKQGQSALKGASLSPSKGPFGVGPTKRGHTKDGYEVTTSVASSTNQSTPDPQEGISLMTTDASHRVFIDSGATNCITPLGDAITHFVAGNIHLILATQGTRSVAKGHGVLTLKFHGKSSSVDVKIADVIVDPSARSTYLSTGALQVLALQPHSRPIHTLSIV